MFLAHSGNPFPMKTTPFLEASRLKHVCCIYKVAYLLPAWSHQPQRGQQRTDCEGNSSRHATWVIIAIVYGFSPTMHHHLSMFSQTDESDWNWFITSIDPSMNLLWRQNDSDFDLCWVIDIGRKMFRQWNRSGGLHQPSHKVQIIKLIWILEPRVQQSHHLNSADRGAPSPIPGDRRRRRHIQSSQTGFLCWCYAAARTTSAAAAAEEAMTAAAEGRTAWRDRR